MYSVRVDESRVSKTTRGGCRFECLYDGLNGCCEVEKCNDTLKILLKCMGSKYCVHKKFIGFSSYACTCPTRIASYKEREQ